MEQLTPHFSLDEMVFSGTAARLGIDNTPPSAAVTNLRRLALLLESIRAQLGCPITITSGYRSLLLNAAVRGQPVSAHTYGRAADFVSRNFGSPLDVARVIADRIEGYDQLIYEFGRWVHVSIPAAGKLPRSQVLTINRHGTRFGFHEEV